MDDSQIHGPLHGLKVLDLSRILAGPTCTQLLGDMGADVIKVENPATGGDDTRTWGPPYVEMADGSASDISAYFICANRNKRSVAVDISTNEGQQIIRDLAATADVFIENFKPGSLAKYGLDYKSLKDEFPKLVYCSISGYGQTGPNASKPGYDLMAQGYGGIMSLTGDPEGEPMKVGVGIADVMCGMYATTGILAALRHRDATGQGQQIDIALVDSQISWLINEGVNYRISGQLPERRGNGHPNIVPYQTCAASDGHVILAVGNDTQFQRFMNWLGLGGKAGDPRFATNPARLENRDALYEMIDPLLAKRPMAEIISGLEAIKVPVGPVNTLDQVMESDQVEARDMAPSVPSSDAASGSIPILGNPLKFSETPITYRRPPPRFGADTDAVLSQLYSDEVD